MTDNEDTHPAIKVAKDFLATMEARNLDQAESYLDANIKMIYPGNATFSDLAGLAAWAKDRYRFVKKSFDGFDAVQSSNSAPNSADGSTDGSTIVYCFGTLYGEWLDGSPFSNIRFIDRFDIRSGKITCHQVWNDISHISNLQKG